VEPRVTGEAPREGTRLARELLEHGRPQPGPKPAQLLRPFRWLDVHALLQSRNDTVSRLLGDPTERLRAAWIARLAERAGGRLDLTVRDLADREAVAFALVGDPGEGDWSQAAVVPPLLAAQERCDFMVICSDVVYPAGDVDEYVEKFYEPYAGWRRPILALPGNHDWYDELEGFMYHFCGMDAPPRTGRRPPLWRRPRRRSAAAERARGDRPPERRDQPGPYFLVDAGPVALVCVDTGISGRLDREQGAWLRRVSAEHAKPKLLLTGKPLVVDGRYAPGAIDGQDCTVDDIVRNPGNGYVAAIGGDIHNYQRYSAPRDGRPFEYVVSGGGGAFMHATHRIGPVDLGGIGEDEFHCFPLRGDSLRFYAQTIVPALARLVWLSVAVLVVLVVVASAAAFGLSAATGEAWSGILIAALVFAAPLAVSGWGFHAVRSSGALRAVRLRGVDFTPQQASTYISEAYGIPQTFAGREEMTPRQRELAEFVLPRGHETTGVLHRYLSEVFDVDDPPLYKQFLLVEADRDAVTLTCCAAIGADVPGGHREPLVEDRVRIPLGPARAAIAAAQAAREAARS
jgi:calcineurin-like phosphoesterase family protein